MDDIHISVQTNRKIEEIAIEMSPNSRSSNLEMIVSATTRVSLLDKLNQSREPFQRKTWKKHCIYRVPWSLKTGNGGCKPDPFGPRFFSIGPYHYGEPHLQPMQFHKFQALHTIVDQSGKDIRELLEATRRLGDEARACYEDLPETIFPTEVFVEVLLLDACFILSAFKMLPNEYHRDDFQFTKPYLLGALTMDMILVENQIPLFVINEIYQILFNCPHEDKVIDSMLRNFYSVLVIGRELTSDEGKLSSSKLKRTTEEAKNNVQTCMETFWHSLMYDSTTKEYRDKVDQSRSSQNKVLDVKHFVIPSITELTEAGVHLRRKNTTPFWDINFEDGVLEIPQIMIYEMSESIFLNLMAFELRHFDEAKYKIISYIVLMDSLVNSASDVAQLRDHGIIVSAGPSDKAIAYLFNRLGKTMFFPLDQILPVDQIMKLSGQIHEHCQKRRHKWRSFLMHNYFKNPWTIISVIAATILLILALLQTGYTIEQYYKKSS